MAPWAALAGVILGLVAGTDFGARLANRVDRPALRPMLFVFVSAMAVYMAMPAWRAESRSNAGSRGVYWRPELARRSTTCASMRASRPRTSMLAAPPNVTPLGAVIMRTRASETTSRASTALQ
jgi:hypothetical protein